jgi:hypothetical protein
MMEDKTVEILGTLDTILYESGLWTNSGISEAWGRDETITDLIAIQSPKMFKAFKEAGCL